MTEFDWAVREASRCLLCDDPPCFSGCPSQINPKLFIRSIKWRDLRGAAKMLRDANPFYGVCGHLCPASNLCAKGCVASGLDYPIDIRRLQKFVFEQEMKDPLSCAVLEKGLGPVAIVGAGPAGLSAAAYLSRFNIAATVFEKEGSAGGLIRDVIPNFRISKDALDYEISFIKSLGVEFKFGSEVKGVHDLLSFGFKAVIVAHGMHKEKKLNFAGENLKGVMGAYDFLRRFNSGNLEQNLFSKRIAVIGGGDTAVDVALSARKLGLDVVVVYRRPRSKMPANQSHVCEAEHQGVEFLFSLVVNAATGKEGVEAINCTRGVWEKGLSGEAFVAEKGGFVIPVTGVIVAAGYDLDKNLGLSVTPHGEIAVRKEDLSTSMKGVFAAGDAAGGSTIAQAVGMGKRAAMSVWEMLK